MLKGSSYELQDHAASYSHTCKHTLSLLSMQAVPTSSFDHLQYAKTSGMHGPAGAYSHCQYLVLFPDSVTLGTRTCFIHSWNNELTPEMLQSLHHTGHEVPGLIHATKNWMVGTASYHNKATPAYQPAHS